MPKVNPEILTWARETAGLSREEAARKLQIRDARGVRAADRLACLESGAEEPTRPTLTRMAKQYRRPLLTFYLSAPPRTEGRWTDFRTLPGDQDPAAYALVNALLRDMSARQSMVRAALEDEDEAEPIPFIGSIKMSDGKQAALHTLRAILEMPKDSFYGQSNADSAFAALRGRIEDEGVFVLLKGDLGSYHTAIDAEAFRGFAIADEVAPFIVINDRDARAAWSFTLLHELVHLILGQTGMRGDYREDAAERFCDGVASEFLLPEEDLALLKIALASEPAQQIETRVSDFARRRNLSSSMVAYRAYSANMIDRGTYSKLRSESRKRWMEERKRQREQNRGSAGGPNYYIVRRHRSGGALLGLARRMLETGAFSTTKAAKVLGIKPTQVGSMLGYDGAP